jgi:RimJ/RimL family protein N-acetyltransferase
VHFIDADIKSVNKASQVAFEGIGFAKTKESEDLLRYEYLV